VVAGWGGALRRRGARGGGGRRSCALAGGCELAFDHSLETAHSPVAIGPDDDRQVDVGSTPPEATFALIGARTRTGSPTRAAGAIDGILDASGTVVPKALVHRGEAGFCSQRRGRLRGSEPSIAARHNTATLRSTHGVSRFSCDSHRAGTCSRGLLILRSRRQV